MRTSFIDDNDDNDVPRTSKNYVCVNYNCV